MMKYNIPTKAIITDAGFASRFLPWTKTNPKAMAPFGNKPIMQFVVEECVAAGIDDIIIVTTEEGKPIYDDYFNNAIVRVKKQLNRQGKVDRYDEVQHVLDYPRIRVIVQDQSLPYGNGSPIVSARKYISDDEAFVVLYSDDVVFNSSDAKTLIDTYKTNPSVDAIIMAQEINRDETDKYGIISLDDTGTGLASIVEKPKIDEAPSLLASYGRYLLTPKVFDYLDPTKTGKDGELWTVDAITRLVSSGGKVLVEKTKGQWLTTGDPKNYFLALLKYVMDNEPYWAEAKTFLLDQLKSEKL